MISVKTFVFNPFQLNTYLVSDENGAGVIIDAGNYTNAENSELFAFIESAKINIGALLLTHCHIDHILGVKAISEKFNVPVLYHEAGQFLVENAPLFGSHYGFQFGGFSSRIKNVKDSEFYDIDGLKFKVLYTPGHVDGSVCFHFEQYGKLFSGDVLFRKGIGRTDLPTGDYDILENSIRKKLYVLDSSTEVYPGHGPSTTIGFERNHNPFFQG